MTRCGHTAVDLRRSADVQDLAGAPLGEEPQVAVELDLLQGHRPADQRAVGRDRGEQAGPLVLQQLGDLRGLLRRHATSLPADRGS